MPDLLHKGGLTMTIFRQKTPEAIQHEHDSLFPSIQNPDPFLPVPDFTYSSDSLAQIIVDAWIDKEYRDQLLERDSHGRVTVAAAQLATSSVNAAGFNLTRAVVIAEHEYFNHYTVPAKHDNEVVFVLPNLNRMTPRPGQSLLETARLLMATTPNGI
jgi:hypothetical protein